MSGLARQNGETRLAQQRTSVDRWDPWSEFNRIRSEMDSLFGGFFGGCPQTQAVTPAQFTPAVDLYETPDEIVLNAYLPGMSREDIHVEVLGHALRLSGESKPNFPENARVHFTHGGYGRFNWQYRLPVEVNADQVRATYRNGILEIRLPKADSAKPRAVEIEVEG